MATSTQLKAMRVGEGEDVGLTDGVFAVEPNRGLLHEVVRAEGAAKRQGTASTKTRAEVSGGRRKPFRQKGTGNARQGTNRAPQFAGGGVAFGPQPRSYAVKVNRKAYRKARAMALSLHAAEGSLGVFDAAFDAPSTKGAISLVAPWRDVRPMVVVLDPSELTAALSFRNLPRSLVLTPSELEVTDILWARSLLVSDAALRTLEGMLGVVTSDEEASA